MILYTCVGTVLGAPSINYVPGLGILKMVTVGHVEYMNGVVGGLGILKMVTVGHGGGVHNFFVVT